MAKILIAEDEPKFMRLLVGRLHRLHDVTPVINGSDARLALQDPGHGFDLVISDLHMEGIDGFELLRWLRYESKTPRLPFVLYTKDWTEPTKHLVARLGGIYVHKQHDVFFPHAEIPTFIAKEVVLATA